MDILVDATSKALSPSASDVPTSTPISTTTTATVPTTTAAPSSLDVPEYVGFICVIVAVLMYGSNAVPVKKFYTGDGMFFQWVVCSTIFLAGLILQCVLQSQFHTLAILGGAIWATGNLCVVLIIRCIGLSMGMCIWGMFNLLAGWSSERFGLFGLDIKPLGRPVLNYIGLALTTFSPVIFAFIRPDVRMPLVEMTITADPETTEPLLNSGVPSNRGVSTNRRYYTEEPDLIFSRNQDNPNLPLIDRLTDFQRKVIGVSLSVISGIMYGFNFAPPIYVMEHYPNVSKNAMDYIFAHFCGIFLASSFYFLVYCIVKKNKPKVYPRAILPAVLYGGMWSIGTGCWFVANAVLSESVSFPIICTGPGAFASLFWGIFIFKEIKGVRNILILLLGLSFTVSGSTLAGFSLTGAHNSTSS